MSYQRTSLVPRDDVVATGPIAGTRTDQWTGEAKPVTLHFEVITAPELAEELGPSKYKPIYKHIFQLKGGPTGYESFYVGVTQEERIRQSANSWCACAGTKPVGPVAGWDRLDISAAEMTRAFQEAGLIHKEASS